MIDSIYLKNYKSIRDAENIKFSNLNVLIGQNGAGKSNLIGFFKFLNKIISQDIQIHVKTTGRANSYLYFGQKKSSFIEAGIYFINDSDFLSNSYKFKFMPTQDGGFLFDKELSGYNRGSNENPDWEDKSFTQRGAFESEIINTDAHRNVFLKEFFSNLRIFHFHDTSNTAAVKGFCNINDGEVLREDAGNLAAFLYNLSKFYPKYFKVIEKTIQSVAPFFNRFDLKPSIENPSEINLRWLEKGSDEYFDAHYLSDGTLRFISLATLLLQPNPPGTIIIDEPELGLHPFAINKLAAILKVASGKTQVIISTQSINLLDQFSPEDIMIVEKQDNQSVFKRLESDKLTEWLSEYSIAELWDKNVIGGRP